MTAVMFLASAAVFAVAKGNGASTLEAVGVVLFLCFMVWLLT